MIVSGSFRDDKMTLSARSPFEADIVKGGLVGDNSFTNAPPFGNRVDFSLNSNTITITKTSGRPLSYEEVKSFIKKIILFGKISEKEAKNLLDTARVGLGSRLTFFYPNSGSPKIEISFANNWVSIEFDNHNFDEVFEKTCESIKSHQKDSLKVNHSSTKNITIHDYSLGSIYIKRSSFNGIADAIIKDGVLLPGEKYTFVTRACAFNAKSVIYIEARNLTKSEEAPEFADNKALDPLIGRKEYLVPFIGAMDNIAKRGGFANLSQEQLSILRFLISHPQEIEKYSPSPSIRETIKAFVEDFSEEITA